MENPFGGEIIKDQAKAGIAGKINAFLEEIKWRFMTGSKRYWME